MISRPYSSVSDGRRAAAVRAILGTSYSYQGQRWIIPLARTLGVRIGAASSSEDHLHEDGRSTRLA